MASGAGAARGMQAGMAAGGAFGGTGAAIGAIGGLLIGAFGGDPTRHARRAMEAYNAQVVKNTAMDLFDKERAQQVERMRTAKALQSYQAQGKTQISSVRAGYGAADLIGGSAIALANAIDYQTEQAKAATMFNYEISFDNYLMSLEQSVSRGANALQQTIDSAPRQAMDIGQLFQAGKSAYDAYKSSRGTAAWSNYWGTTAGNTTGSSNQFISGANPMQGVSLNFKGF